jgi:hypothetical protein
MVEVDKGDKLGLDLPLIVEGGFMLLSGKMSLLISPLFDSS